MQSMTGYGKETSRQGDWEMTVELRAVNHRFLDLSMRLGRGLTFLEETIRKTLAPLCRGHVDVQLTLRRISGSDSDVTVDETLAAENYAVGFKKGDDTLKDQVQEQLEALAADGTLAKISEKWFDKDITTIGK